jgi:CRP/FNR family transcriptional regulator, cyclic AMP receptor protein
LGDETGFWLGQIGLAICAIALLFRDQSRFRGLFAVGLALGLGAAFISTAAPNGFIIWASIFLGATTIPLLHNWVKERSFDFSDEELELGQVILGDSPPSSVRHFISQGHWITGRSGETLARENEAIGHLFYLSSGRADIFVSGKQVGTCGRGELIGDATALTGSPATGTVVLADNSRFWCISAPALRRYLELHPRIAPTVQARINRALEEKLKRANNALSSKD